ncbi:MAG: sulfite exporter TauE/SafE family protein [Victivallaceae bacterium]|nr:sulfite exporter TauE/SafE family protein [Victivallaceae bacterium]
MLFGVFAAVIGLVAMTASGYWGVGCGWLVVPVLLYAGADAETAAAISLLQVFPAGIGTVAGEFRLIGWKRGGFGWKLALPLALAGMTAAVFGKSINNALTGHYGSSRPIELLLLISTLVATALIFVRPRGQNPCQPASITPCDTVRGCIGAAAVALTAATLGIGGGVLFRPVLTLKLKLSGLIVGRLVRLFLVTSSLAAGLVYLLGDGSLNTRVLWPAAAMAVGGVCGFPLGRRLSRVMRECGYGSDIMTSYAVVAAAVVTSLALRLLGMRWAGMVALAAGGVVLTAMFAVIWLYIPKHKRIKE